MSLTQRASSAKHQGRVRDTNEDDVYSKTTTSSEGESLGLYIVADGMGGNLGGEHASKWTVKTIVSELQDLFAPTDPRRTVKLATAALTGAPHPDGAPAPPPEAAQIEEHVRRAVQRANQAVRDFGRARPEEAGDAGSTVTMALIKDQTAYVANVGDSRTYLLREDALQPVTKDHSLVATLVAIGQIQPEDIYTHPQRNLIFRSLGGEAQVEVDIFRLELQAGDRLLLCSDGLWEMVHNPQLKVLMAKAPDPKSACQRMIKAANDNGGEDNISAVVVWIEA